MKIINLLKIAGAVLFLSVFVGSGVSYYFNSQMLKDSRVVNYAGIVRGMTQRMVKLELAGDYSKAKELSAELDKIVKGLKRGDESLDLSKAQDERFINVLAEIELAWAGLKKTAKRFEDNPSLAAGLIEESENYYLLANRAVSVAEEFSRDKVRALRGMLAFFFLVNSCVIFSVWIIVARKIFKPLKKLTAVLPKVAEGDFSQRIEIKSKNEMGQMAGAFNEMAAKLTQTYADLGKFKLAIENATDQIMITDPNGKILYANKAAEKLTGYSREEIIGNRPSLWGGQMSPDFYKAMWYAIKTEKRSFIGELANVNKNGRRYSVELRIAPILDLKGEVEYFVGIERDITKEKEIDKAKTEFISFASHQLRTPPSAIKWCLEILLGGKAGKLSGQQRKYLKDIEELNRRMVEMTRTFLNVSHLELGTLVSKKEPVDIALAVKGALKEAAAPARKKKIKISKQYENNLPKAVADHGLLMVVFQNILSNAVKYTPLCGTIAVSAFLKKMGEKLNDSMADKNMLVVSVFNNGPIIPKDKQDKIFTKFFRAGNAPGEESEGTGLGLYIAKEIMNLMGGEIWFSSEEGKGTTFYVALPVDVV